MLEPIMKTSTRVLLILACTVTLSAQTVTYSLYSLPIWGHRKLISEGICHHSPSVQTITKNKHFERHLRIDDRFSIGVIAYNEPEVIGIHLTVNTELNYTSINYFSNESGNIFCGPWLHGKPRTDYGGGKFRVRIIRTQNREEPGEIEFLDDVTIGASNEHSAIRTFLRMLPFGNNDTLEVTFKKGSIIYLQP
jgi:hypothetical protein